MVWLVLWCECVTGRRNPSKVQGLRLLRGVGVDGAGVHVQLAEHRPAEWSPRQHPLHRELDDRPGARSWSFSKLIDRRPPGYPEWR